MFHLTVLLKYCLCTASVLYCCTAGATYRVDLEVFPPADPVLFRRTTLKVPHNPGDYETKQVSTPFSLSHQFLSLHHKLGCLCVRPTSAHLPVTNEHKFLEMGT